MHTLFCKTRGSLVCCCDRLSLPTLGHQYLLLTPSPVSSSSLSSIHSEFMFRLTASVFTCLFHYLENKVIVLIPRGVNYRHRVLHPIFHFQPKLPFCTWLAHITVRGGSVDWNQRGGKYVELVYPNPSVHLEKLYSRVDRA